MQTTIHIQNLKCGGCANTITKGISSIETINNIAVNVEDSSVTFDYASDEKLIEVKEKLKSLGYPEDGEQLLLHIARVYILNILKTT
jgi:copper chaperone CopZ